MTERHNVRQRHEESSERDTTEREPDITYPETLTVINDWYELLQVESINE